MFLEHFGLRGDPFGVTADARFLYFSQEHKDALSALYLSIIEGRGVSALIAHAGMGKTTLLRYLAARLRSHTQVAFLGHPYRLPADLMGEVLRRLGAESGATELERMGRLQDHLRRMLARRTKVVLLFDECQSLSPEAVEQIRLLSNLRSSDMNLLEIVMAGQSELDDVLQAPEYEALRQRISVVARLRRFNRNETAAYLERRLQVAGRSEPLFSADAIDAVADFSGGIPRNINQLAYKALSLAWADDAALISAGLVEEAARNLEWRPGGSAAAAAARNGPAAAQPAAVGDLREEASPGRSLRRGNAGGRLRPELY